MSSIFSKNPFGRQATRLALLGAVIISAIGISAGPALANTTYSAGTVNAAGSCNRYNHTLSFGGSITLSNRYPNGAWVAVRYAYWNVNAAGQATSTVATTPWQVALAPAPMTYIGDMTIGPNAFFLPGPTYNASGSFKIAVQVGVWNGTSYDYSPWDTDNDGYDIYGQFGIYSYASVCLTSFN